MVRTLNKICFTICIVCIVLGAVLGLAMVWSDLRSHEFVWKAWVTIGILFLASAMTLSVSKTYLGRGSRWAGAEDAEPEALADRPREDRSGEHS